MVNNLQVVIDGLLAHRLINVLQRTEFVAVFLILLILKSVGVYSIKPDVVLCSENFNSPCIFRYIPWNVEGNGAAGFIERMQQAYVLDLFFETSGFSSSGEPSKPCTASA